MFSNDDEDEDDQYEEEDDQPLVKGVHDYQRVALVDPLFDDNFNKDMGETRRKMIAMTAEEKFRKTMKDFIAHDFNEIDNVEVTFNDKQEIRDLIDHIGNVEYKNPKTFFLAWWFLKTEKNNPASFQAFAQKYSLEKKDAKDAKEYNQENDLLRYIRFVEPRLKSLYHKK